MEQVQSCTITWTIKYYKFTVKSVPPPPPSQVNVGLKEVDNLTLGMGGAADTLLVAARSGDSGLLAEQTQAVRSLASSLQSIAKDAVAGYDTCYTGSSCYPS